MIRVVDGPIPAILIFRVAPLQRSLSVSGRLKTAAAARLYPKDFGFEVWIAARSRRRNEIWALMSTNSVFIRLRTFGS